MQILPGDENMTNTKQIVQITRCATLHCPTQANYEGLCYLCHFAPVEFTFAEPNKRIALWTALVVALGGAVVYWFAK